MHWCIVLKFVVLHVAVLQLAVLHFGALCTGQLRGMHKHTYKHGEPERFGRMLCVSNMDLCFTQGARGQTPIWPKLACLHYSSRRPLYIYGRFEAHHKKAKVDGGNKIKRTCEEH